MGTIMNFFIKNISAINSFVIDIEGFYACSSTYLTDKPT